MKPSPQAQQCGCIVVLYHPDETVNERLLDYARHLPFLYLIDNTEESIASQLPDFSAFPATVRYIHNANQGGLARALNIGCMEALQQDCQWALTMDQDSEFQEGALDALWRAHQTHTDRSIGLIAPYHLMPPQEKTPALPKYGSPLSVMTSGNLINLAAYKEVGPFDETLFIDAIDHDYCLRLRLAGFAILQANQAVLLHRLGQPSSHQLFGIQERGCNYPALRRYYITRNRLRVASRYRKKFPGYFWREIRHIIRDTIMVLFFEKEKLQKVQMTYRGICDFFLGKKGEYSKN